MKKILLSLLCLVGFIAANAGTADLNTLNGGKTSTSYSTYSTTSGWTATNSAVLIGATTDSNPKFKFIDLNELAVCLNGKKSTIGTLVSPNLTGGIGTLSLKYGLPYSDTKFSVTVNVKQNGAVVATTKLAPSSVTQKTAYEFSYDFNISGDFVLEFINDCPSGSTSNKDRSALWNISWTEYAISGEVTAAIKPSIVPNGGEVVAGTPVTITSATENATIYYTLDGTEPSTENGNVYSTPIVINESCTVKAIATAEGLEASEVASADFTVIEPVSFGYVTNVTSGKKYLLIADDTFMATPLAESSTYGYIQVSSVAATEGYVEILKPEPFTITEVEGGYTIQDSFGRYLYQTGDHNSFNVAATMPTDGSAVWAIEVQLDGTAKIFNTSVSKWMQYDTEYNSYGSYNTAKGIMPYLYEEGATAQAKPTIPSLYAVGGFNGWDAANMPEFTFENGVYTLSIEAAGDLGLKISTGNGDWSAIDAGVYGVSGAVVSGETLSLVAGNKDNITLPFAGSWTIVVDLLHNTFVATGVKNYPNQIFAIGNVNGANWSTSAGMPLVHTEDGVYEGVVTIDDAGSGMGYFQFATALGDNWDAVNAAPRYGALTKDEVIVIGEATSMTNNWAGGTQSWSIAAGTYNMVVDVENCNVVVSLIQVEAPVITPNGGAILASQEITIECATEGASIYYTLDGTEPTEESTLYEAPFTLPGECTVKAIAVADGMEASAVVETAFTFINEEIKVATFDFTNPSSLTPSYNDVPTGGDGVSINGVVFTAGPVSVKCDKGSAGTDCRLFLSTTADSNIEVRTYKNSTITISGTNANITSIEFTGSAASATQMTADGGEFTGKVWTAEEGKSVSSVVFTAKATTKINTITVNYENAETGVEGVEVENDATVEYYNLQGVKVNNPANGIFIKVQGNKASKVYVK